LGESGQKHLAESGKNSREFGIVTLLISAIFGRKSSRGGECGAELEEGTPDSDVRLQGAITAENVKQSRQMRMGMMT
jgi:hypothetical protein